MHTLLERRISMADDALVCWEDLEQGTAITEPGCARKMKTGDWKTNKPVVDEEKCIKCALCAVYCPEFCIAENEEGFFHSDLDYCKGCGICANECPKDAISMVREED
jgi:pyruvate ferredoxin oxidoreductase delta subunit